MDPVTHLSSGLMGGLAARKWFPESRFLVPACMLAAWIPDADIFLGGDQEFHLLYHRGLTTSFFGAAILALVVTGFFKLANRSVPSLKSWALFYALCLTHVWLDLITTYGTQLLAPFSNHRFALHGSFIIDPLFTVTALALIMAAWLVKEKRHAIAMIGMAWFFFYPLANMGASAWLETVYAHRLETRDIPFDQVEVTPDALSPRYWKVVTTAGPDYLLDIIDLFGDEPTEPMRLKRASKEQLRELGEQVSMFSTYAWFSLWPYVWEEPAAEGRTLVFHDLRFLSLNPVLGRFFSDRDLPFTLTAHLDPSGRITDWAFEGGFSSRNAEDATP